MNYRSFVVSAFALIALIGVQDSAGADTRQPKPRRQFVRISIDRFNTLPLHFKQHPLEDLLGGRDLADGRFETFDYQTRDGQTTIDVLEYGRRGRGAGITVFPFGSRTGATLAVRGSYEELPPVRIAFHGVSPIADYRMIGARALDLGVGVIVSDRAPGWGLGSHAFVVGGAGRIRDYPGGGNRYFGEAGGGISVGPIGVELAVKVAYNQLTSPSTHSFYTVPVSLRGTVSF